MLVAPMGLRLGKVGPLFGLRWWIGDLCDQEGSRSFSNTIDENTEERDLEEYEETNAKSKKHAFAVVEPDLLLLRGEADARKVGLELCCLLEFKTIMKMELDVLILSSNS